MREKYSIVFVFSLLLLTACSRRPEIIETPVPETPSPTVTMTAEPTATPAPETTPTATPQPMPESTPYRPDIDVTSWEYILANADHPIGEYAPELVEVEYGHKFDVRAVDALELFIADCRAAGNSVYLSSAYRSYAEQKYLFERKVAQYGGNEAIAATIVLPPGTSEHQTGLSADITDRYYELKNSSLENTAMFQWMNEHCAEYGFILRYPSDKEDITKVTYEPWHFRYVGVEAATFMKEENLCLEEFLALYEE